MADKVKVLADLSTLTKMCHSKSDGATLVIEEREISSKIADLKAEIDEEKASSAEDNYDTSAEMADRNIEIISKKVIQNLKSDLKVKNAEMDKLKVEEEEKSNNLNNTKRTRKSYEKYIASMQDRIANSTDQEVINRYNGLITNTENKITALDENLKSQEADYIDVQSRISTLSEEINKIEENIGKKQELLQEAQKNLENKDTYIDKSKAERTAKKVSELQEKIDKLTARLEEIHEDPKYLEAKIKDVVQDGEDPFNARDYLVKLLSMCSKIPYMNVDIDNALEEELLRATQARDALANEIDSKTYDVMETINPEQIRIEYLNTRINKWETELAELEKKIASIDKDEEFDYESKTTTLDGLIESLKNELVDYKKAYEAEPESNLTGKATLKVALDEKQADLNAAIEIASKFRKDEAHDIADASHMIKVDVEELKEKIDNAKSEIEEIKSRLMSKKSGMLDIGAQNRDREKLKELAKVVIDIKHRRNFEEKPIDIARRLETELGLDLVSASFTDAEVAATPTAIVEETKTEEPAKEPAEEPRGVKVVDEKVIETNPVEPEPKVEEQPAQAPVAEEVKAEPAATPEPIPVVDVPNDLATELDNYMSSIESPKAE